MISAKQLVKLMAEHGVLKATVTGKGGESMTFEMPRPEPPPAEYIELPRGADPAKPWTPEEIAQIQSDYGNDADLDNSAEMTEPAEELERLRRAKADGSNDIYEDPDLYPDGVDPVASAKEYRKALGEKNVQ